MTNIIIQVSNVVNGGGVLRFHKEIIDTSNPENVLIVYRGEEAINHNDTVDTNTLILNSVDEGVEVLIGDYDKGFKKLGVGSPNKVVKVKPETISGDSKTNG